MSSAPVFSGDRVTRSLVLCVCFIDRCLSFCTFSFGHYIVCSSSILMTTLVSFGHCVVCSSLIYDSNDWYLQSFLALLFVRR